MAPILPYLGAATAVMGMVNRSNANATLNEPMFTNEQIAGDVIGNAARDPGIGIGTGGGTGLVLDASSPGVVDALRRRTLVQRQRRAYQTLQSPDPFSLLPSIVGMFNGGGGGSGGDSTGLDFLYGTNTGRGGSPGY